MSNSAPKRLLVTFGRSDPLHLTEATYEILGSGPIYIWGPEFNRDKPEWADEDWELLHLDDDCKYPLFDLLHNVDIVYCGHGATLLEATAAGCEVMVLTHINPIKFDVAWDCHYHLDHSGRIVKWWNPEVMAKMAAEIRDRRHA